MFTYSLCNDNVQHTKFHFSLPNSNVKHLKSAYPSRNSWLIINDCGKCQ